GRGRVLLGGNGRVGHVAPRGGPAGQVLVELLDSGDGLFDLRGAGVLFGFRHRSFPPFVGLRSPGKGGRGPEGPRPGRTAFLALHGDPIRPSRWSPPAGRGTARRETSG